MVCVFVSCGSCGSCRVSERKTERQKEGSVCAVCLCSVGFFEMCSSFFFYFPLWFCFSRTTMSYAYLFKVSISFHSLLL